MDAERRLADPLIHFVEAMLRDTEIDSSELARAQRVADHEAERIDLTLNRLGLLSDREFVDIWAAALDMPVADEESFPRQPILVEELPASFVKHAQVLPVRTDDGVLILAIGDPLDSFTPAAVSQKTGLRTVLHLATPGALSRSIQSLYASENEPSGGDMQTIGVATDVQRLRDRASGAPVIRYVQALLEEAVRQRASDIHIALGKNGPDVKLRVDGSLRPAGPLPLELYEAVISRVKTLSGLDPAERRLPQDGSTRSVVSGMEYDFRVATMPHLGGEGIVIRVLAKEARAVELASLGLSDDFIGNLTKILQSPHGMILMTGPTGSGKTTTLYGALQALDRSTRNVITIEDPVELHLDGIKQVEVNHKIGLTFSTALRAALRQDPDVILVGEIRDTETASIAVRAAMTGHLVLASLHTNSAVAAIPRLCDMGIEPYLLASTIKAVMSQRLLRRLCDHCKEKRDGGTGYRAVGCEKCARSGYYRRVAVAELVPITPELQSLVRIGSDASLLDQHVQASGVETMRRSAFRLIEDGATSEDEVHRVLSGAD